MLKHNIIIPIFWVGTGHTMSKILSIWLNKNVVVIKNDKFRVFGKCIDIDDNFINIQDYMTHKIRSISFTNIFDIVDDDKQNNKYRG